MGMLLPTALEHGGQKRSGLRDPQASPLPCSSTVTATCPWTAAATVFSGQTIEDRSWSLLLAFRSFPFLEPGEAQAAAPYPCYIT